MVVEMRHFVIRRAVFLLASLVIYFVPAVATAEPLRVDVSSCKRALLHSTPGLVASVFLFGLFAKIWVVMTCSSLNPHTWHRRGMLNPKSRQNAFDYEGKEFASGGPTPGKY